MSTLYKSFLVSLWLVALAISTPIQATELRFLSGAHLPFSIQEKEKGIHVDIVKAAFAESGHTIVVDFTQYININSAIEKREYDIISPALAQDLSKDMYVSEIGFAFQNGAVTLRDAEPIVGFEDFEEKQLIAFRGAKLFLGSEYSHSVGLSRSYRETSQFLEQLADLQNRSADISIGDIHLASYAAVLHPALTPEDIILNPIFEPLPYYFVFKDANIRDQFDKGVNLLINSGDYQRIVGDYINEN